MKTITITTKSAANKILVNSLFNPVNGKTLSAMPLDGGKYRVDPETPYIGRVIETHDAIHAVYPVKRKDKYGAYIKLFCVCED